MAAESNDIRNKTRKVKNIILDKFFKLSEACEATVMVKDGVVLNEVSVEDRALYKELLLTFAKNVVPRTQEITGEEGEAINIKVMKYGDSITAPIPTEGLST